MRARGHSPVESEREARRHSINRRNDAPVHGEGALDL
jgi:hypothetical protein